MRVRHYTKNDYRSLAKWLRKRGHADVSATDLPTFGFVVPGVAMGFIRRCEGQVAIFDSLVSNPYVSSETRHKALDALFEAIKLKTENMGYKRLIGFTVDVGTCERAKKHGFKQIQHMILAKE